MFIVDPARCPVCRDLPAIRKQGWLWVAFCMHCYDPDPDHGMDHFFGMGFDFESTIEVWNESADSEIVRLIALDRAKKFQPGA